MADTHELNESMIVSEGIENEERASEGDGLNGDATAETCEAPEAAADGTPFRKSRAKRASVKSIESRVAALEERVESFARELAQLTRMTEQLAHLNGKIASLEESVAARSNGGGGVGRDGAGIAEQVRQLDERMQKLAVMLAQQNWNRV